MSKPEWKDAPKWAKWLAADETSHESRQEFWVFFETKPVFKSGGWLVNKIGGKWFQTKCATEIGCDAENSLEPRP
jgi:hypothetical protein